MPSVLILRMTLELGKSQRKEVTGNLLALNASFVSVQTPFVKIYGVASLHLCLESQNPCVTYIHTPTPRRFSRFLKKGTSPLSINYLACSIAFALTSFYSFPRVYSHFKSELGFKPCEVPDICSIPASGLASAENMIMFSTEEKSRTQVS